MPLTSKQINDKIREMEKHKDTKPVPYLGWMWREVDFDDDSPPPIGIAPPDEEDDNVYVGFMLNNKWGYSYARCSTIQWQSIKEAIIQLVEEPSKEHQERVYMVIQNLYDPNVDILHSNDDYEDDEDDRR